MNIVINGLLAIATILDITIEDNDIENFTIIDNATFTLHMQQHEDRFVQDHRQHRC